MSFLSSYQLWEWYPGTWLQRSSCGWPFLFWGKASKQYLAKRHAITGHTLPGYF